MKPLSIFVLATLGIELSGAFLYVHYLGGDPFWNVLFYVLISSWAYWRASHVIKNIRMTANSAMFALVMLCSSAVCSLMALIVGMTAVAANYQLFFLLESGLVALYDFSRSLFGHMAVLLTIGELLSLIIHKIARRRSGMERLLLAGGASVNSALSRIHHRSARSKVVQ